MNTKHVLDGLLQNKFLTLPAYERLLGELCPLNAGAWLSARLLMAASVFILAGVICFFAANWQHLGQMLKLGLPLAGLLACGAGAWYKGVQTAAGQAFGFGAGVLIGVFLAVFGQVFQTGAFVHQLFGPWCLLLVPLALILRNKWFWLMPVYVGAIYWISKSSSWNPTWPLWYGFNGLFIAAWVLAEVFGRRRVRVFSRFLWVPFSGFNFCVALIERFSSTHEWAFFIGALAFAVAALVYAWYSKDLVLWAWNAFMLAGLGSMWATEVLPLYFFICAGFFAVAGGAVAWGWPRLREDKHHE